MNITQRFKTSLSAFCFMAVFATAVPAFAAVHMNNSGVLHVTGEWKWCEAGKDLVAEGTLSNEPQPKGHRVKAVDCDRFVWQSFRVPKNWAGRPVWFTYDVCRFAASSVEEIRINGKPVPVSVPRSDTQKNRPVMPMAKPNGASLAQSPAWFCGVAPLLQYGEDNTVAIRIRRWPVTPNVGAWLFSPPLQEKVLFLLSEQLDPKTQRLATEYAAQVEKAFPVKSLIRRASPPSHEALRAYIRRIWVEEGVGGVVLIGEQALPTVQGDGELKAWPRYCETLQKETEATVRANPFHEEMDVWTAWIRSVPGTTDSVAAILKKAIDYYQGRLCFPNTGVIASDPNGNPFAIPSCGLELYDLLWTPADFMYFNAHGGTSFDGLGPHNTVKPDESATIYPGSLMLKLYGCSAGNIARPTVTPAEGFLVGRPVTQVVITHTQPEGGAFKTVAWRTYNDLLRVCPHAGIMYQYFYDMRVGNPYSLIMLGNPFVRIGSATPAPSGSIQGLVKGCDSDRGSALYVTAWRDSEGYGRTRVAQDRRFRLACIPPGNYEVTLHINALETISRKVQVQPNEVSKIDWDLTGVQSVSGSVLLGDGSIAKDAWVELAARPKKQEFADNDLFGIHVSPDGRFSFLVLRTDSLYVRACLGKRTRTPPLQVRIPTDPAINHRAY
jgi:hypothetical protein